MGLAAQHCEGLSAPLASIGAGMNDSETVRSMVLAQRREQHSELKLRRRNRLGLVLWLIIDLKCTVWQLSTPSAYR
jgi:hypothetical protein